MARLDTVLRSLLADFGSDKPGEDIISTFEITWRLNLHRITRFFIVFCVWCSVTRIVLNVVLSRTQKERRM
jgi:hypothetical protein